MLKINDYIRFANWIGPRLSYRKSKNITFSLVLVLLSSWSFYLLACLLCSPDLIYSVFLFLFHFHSHVCVRLAANGSVFVWRHCIFRRSLRWQMLAIATSVDGAMQTFALKLCVWAAQMVLYVCMWLCLYVSSSHPLLPWYNCCNTLSLFFFFSCSIRSISHAFAFAGESLILLRATMYTIFNCFSLSLFLSLLCYVCFDCLKLISRQT